MSGFRRYLCLGFAKSSVEASLLLIAVVGVFAVMSIAYAKPDDTPARGHVSLLTWNHLEQWYPQQPGANGAETYLQAFRAINQPEDSGQMPLVGSASLPAPGTPLPPASARAVRSYLKPQAEAIDLLEAATRTEACWFKPEVFPSGEPNLMSHHPWMRRGVYLLYLSAILEADEGREAEACERIEQITVMADVLYREPTVVACMTSYRFREQACELAEWLVASGRLSNAQRARLSELLDPDASPVPDWYANLTAQEANTPALVQSAQTLRDRQIALRNRLNLCRQNTLALAW